MFKCHAYAQGVVILSTLEFFSRLFFGFITRQLLTVAFILSFLARQLRNTFSIFCVNNGLFLRFLSIPFSLLMPGLFEIFGLPLLMRIFHRLFFPQKITDLLFYMNPISGEAIF